MSTAEVFKEAPESLALWSADGTDTLAALVERLGGIPLERIRSRPAPGTATEADVLVALESPRKRPCELIDGVLVEKAMGFRESPLASLRIELLNAIVRPRNIGLVTAPDGCGRNSGYGKSCQSGWE